MIFRLENSIKNNEFSKRFNLANEENVGIPQVAILAIANAGNKYGVRMQHLARGCVESGIF